MIVFVSDKETANVQLLTQTYITPNLILAQEWVDLYQIFWSRSLAVVYMYYQVQSHFVWEYW